MHLSFSKGKINPIFINYLKKTENNNIALYCSPRLHEKRRGIKVSALTFRMARQKKLLNKQFTLRGVST